MPRPFNEMEVKLTAYQVMDRIVSGGGSSGRVYVPKDWIGKRVKVLLIEDLNNQEEP